MTNIVWTVINGNPVTYEVDDETVRRWDREREERLLAGSDWRSGPAYPPGLNRKQRRAWNRKRR